MTTWYVNRSRYEEGHRCKVARYFGQHYQGWGVSPVSVEMPLATGGLVHHIVEDLNLTGSAPHTAIEIVDKWCNKYVDHIMKTGFRDPDAQEELRSREWRAKEQALLGAGLGMIWAKYGMPEFFSTHTIVSVEQEYPIEIPWDIPNVQLRHEVRPDLVVRNNDTGKLIVVDFKTADFVDEDTFPAKWVDSIQMAGQCAGVERETGEQVEYAVIALEKGMYKSNYNTMTKEYDGPRRQQSPLCYMYFLQGAPPMTEHQYAPKYKYVGSDGKHHNLPKLWEKTPTWELPGLEDYPLYGQRALRLLELMQDKWTPARLLCYAGPYQVNRLLLAAYLDSVAATEEWWYRTLTQEDHKDQSIYRVFPASFACINAWGKKCQFHEICYRESNACDDPLGSGRYQVRTPHHAGELAQQVEAGVVQPTRWDSE